MEGGPEPDLVLIKAGLPFCLLVTFLYRPSLPGYLDQHRQGHRPACRGVAVEERQISRIGDAAADQQPVPRRGCRQPRPLVVAVAFAARPARAGLPAAAGTSRARNATAVLLPEGRVSLKFEGTANTYPLPPSRRRPAASSCARRLRRRLPSRTARCADRRGDHLPCPAGSSSRTPPRQGPSPAGAASYPGTRPWAGRAGSRTGRGRGR